MDFVAYDLGEKVEDPRCPESRATFLCQPRTNQPSVFYPNRESHPHLTLSASAYTPARRPVVIASTTLRYTPLWRQLGFVHMLSVERARNLYSKPTPLRVPTVYPMSSFPYFSPFYLFLSSIFSILLSHSHAVSPTSFFCCTFPCVTVSIHPSLLLLYIPFSA